MKDRDLAKLIEKVSDWIRYSQIQSSDAVMEQEIEIIRLTDKLQDAVLNGQKEAAEKIAKKMMLLVNERNRILKNNN